MITIEITGLSALLAQMDDMGKRQMPFAVAKALTITAKQCAAAETAHIMSVFDRPTPFTQRAIGFTPATKLDLTATIFVKDVQAHYLQAEVDGGARGFKSFEQKFAASGQTAGKTMIAAPSRSTPLNQYGNISKAKILRIASDVNTAGKAKRFFAGQPKGLPMPFGVYARVNNNTKIVPLILFATAAVYKKRFQFSTVAFDTVTANFEANLMAAWDAAISTARR